jgi:D-tyrosyl-tRNA(Tyr) deacylase
MKAIIQRVSESSVTIDKKIYSSISKGLLVLIGIEDLDAYSDIEWLANKVLNLRIFDDENGVMNRSVKDVKGSLLIISQFTLQASTKKGNRPSYLRASKPDIAIPIYEDFVDFCKNHSDIDVQTGIFGADMKVRLLNDGPVTIVIHTKNKV